MAARIVVVHGRSPDQRSAEADGLSASFAGLGDLTEIQGLGEAEALQSEAADRAPLLFVLDPQVDKPFALARRCAATFPSSRIVVVTSPDREDATRREAVLMAPGGGRCVVAGAEPKGLRRVVADMLAAMAQQQRLRTSLDRANLRLDKAPAVDSIEYRRLVASDRYLVGILKSAHDAIVSLDHRGSVVSWNRAAELLFGVPEASARNSSFWNHFDDAPACRQVVMAALGGASERSEQTVTRDGVTTRVEATLDLLRDDAGDATGLAVIMRDTTERHRIEQETLLASRHKDDFLAMLAHELRNPLAPLRTAAKLLSLMPSAEPKARRAVEIIDRQVDHMAGLLDDLLDVARITRGSVVLDREPVSLASVLGDAVEQVRSSMEGKQQQLVFPAVDARLILDGDRKRLVQVFANLLSNSVRFTPTGGKIGIDARPDAAQAVIRVSDDGIGIDAELLPRIFDLFTQGNRTPARTQGGLGIGLALVKTLVDLHEGEVVAESAGAGRGTQLIVRLPRIVGETMELGASPSASHAVRPLRLMVVDDNEDAATALGMILEADGHQVAVHTDPRMALDSAKIERLDACILDIGMPFLNGYELAERIIAMDPPRKPVLIALTGYGQPSDRHRALQAGFDHHLVKPLDPERLNRLLAQLP